MSCVTVLIDDEQKMFFLRGNSMLTIDDAANESLLDSLTWNPVAYGDGVAGRCVLCDFAFPTQFGNKLHIKIAADEAVSDGKSLEVGTYSIWERAQLRSICKIVKLCAGDNVSIVYDKEAATKRGNAKKMFKIKTEKTPESEVWIEPLTDVNDIVAENTNDAFGGKTADEYVGMSGDAERDQILRDSGV